MQIDQWGVSIQYPQDISAEKLYQVIALSLCDTTCYDAHKDDGDEHALVGIHADTDFLGYYRGFHINQFGEYEAWLEEHDWNYLNVLKTWHNDAYRCGNILAPARKLICGTYHILYSEEPKDYEDESQIKEARFFNNHHKHFFGETNPEVFILASHFNDYADPNNLTLNDQAYLQGLLSKFDSNIQKLMQSLVKADFPNITEAAKMKYASLTNE